MKGPGGSKRDHEGGYWGGEDPGGDRNGLDPRCFFGLGLLFQGPDVRHATNYLELCTYLPVNQSTWVEVTRCISTYFFFLPLSTSYKIHCRYVGRYLW